MESKVDEIILVLKENGYKLTHARQEMVRFFLANKKHLTPEQIYDQMKTKKISLPTVYRNIDIFKRLKIIDELDLGDERVYELAMFSKKKLHLHFKCQTCGAIKEYKDSETFLKTVGLRDYVEAHYGDDIQDMKVVFTGQCKECEKSS